MARHSDVAIQIDYVRIIIVEARRDLEIVGHGCGLDVLCPSKGAPVEGVAGSARLFQGCLANFHFK
jgi:hypothetical protein